MADMGDSLKTKWLSFVKGHLHLFVREIFIYNCISLTEPSLPLLSMGKALGLNLHNSLTLVFYALHPQYNLFPLTGDSI